jgi:adenosylcobyric acid synthase
MLGQRILDPSNIESAIKEATGLELLPVETEILLEKETHQALAYLEEAGQTIAPECNGVMTGYEIHMGKTTNLGLPRPFARIFRRGETSVSIDDGTVSNDGRIFGTYLHGIFDNSRFREIYLNRIRHEKGMPQRHGSHKMPVQDPFDRLAEHLEQHLDIPELLQICGLGQ